MAVSAGEPSIFIPPKEECSFCHWKSKTSQLGAVTVEPLPTRSYCDEESVTCCDIQSKIIMARNNITGQLTAGQAYAILYLTRNFYQQANAIIRL
jgi:hypothetical protein